GFFFQAEDGIRGLTVTGVQTCALPIYLGGGARGRRQRLRPAPDLAEHQRQHGRVTGVPERGLRRHPRPAAVQRGAGLLAPQLVRSEERRVGKECRVLWWTAAARSTRTV